LAAGIAAACCPLPAARFFGFASSSSAFFFAAGLRLSIATSVTSSRVSSER